jgi:hypothetical protein
LNRWKATLDQIAQQAAEFTVAHELHYESNPEQFRGSRAFFQALALMTFLNRDLGFKPTDKKGFRESWRDSRGIFLHGLLLGMSGTCSNLPVLYVAVGRRLNYPLWLVHSPHHLFARWDDAAGERFNIECAMRGFFSYPDDHYLNWPIQVPDYFLYGTNMMKSQTPRGELAGFLVQRAACLNANGRHEEAVNTCAWGYRLVPPDRLTFSLIQGFIHHWRTDLLKRLPPPFPKLTIAVKSVERRRGFFLPKVIEEEIMHLVGLEYLSKEIPIREAYQKPVRRSKWNGLPIGLSPNIHVSYPWKVACDWDILEPGRTT